MFALSIAEGLALSGLREGFARRLGIRRRMSTLSLSKGPSLFSSAPLLGRKPSTA